MAEVIKGRKPKARHCAVVIGALEEANRTPNNSERIAELLDELRRSLGRNDEEKEA